jgi:diguanylate cyclase (GGDEF)-like protein
MAAAPHSATIVSRDSMHAPRTLTQRARKAFTRVWSATRFDDTKVQSYAEDVMLGETRRGIVSMAVLSLLIQTSAIVLYKRLGFDGSFLYTYILLALLSLHVVISARFVRELAALNLLGTILLVITGVAIMTMAHRAGSLSAGLMSSIVLLFMVMPLVPWGLREALSVIGLTYLTVTFSMLSVAGRFESETLWTVQFLIVASAAIATLTIARNTSVRKADIKMRYTLEGAHRELELIATRDPLTGAWNRRYLEQNFEAIARAARSTRKDLHLAVLDVDSFKRLNDTHGHHHGDEVLRRLVEILLDNLPGTAHVLRLGGDEFAVLDTSESFESMVRRCLQHLETDPRLLEQSGTPVRVSVGFATVTPDQHADLDLLYRTADGALYEDKDARRRETLTGRWRIVASTEHA